MDTFNPFQSLLLDTETTYGTMLNAFLHLYQNLTEIVVEEFLQTSTQLCTFVTKDRFKNSLPIPCLVATDNDYLALHKTEVSHLMSVILPKLAKGFSDRRGAIFGFEPLREDGTGKIMKILRLK